MRGAHRAFELEKKKIGPSLLFARSLALFTSIRKWISLTILHRESWTRIIFIAFGLRGNYYAHYMRSSEMTSKFKIWKYIRLGLSSLVCRPFLPSKLTGEQRTLLLLVSILFIFAEYCVCVCVWALDLAQDRIVAVNLYYIILYSAARAHCMGIEFHSCWYWTWLCAICCVACWCWCWCVCCTRTIGRCFGVSFC